MNNLETNVTKSKKISEKFQFDDVSAIYCIKHKPTGSIYIGCTTGLKLRMRNHISKLRKGNHPNLVLQALWDQCPDEKEWKAFILTDGEDMTKKELHKFETDILLAVENDPGDLILINAYKHSKSYREILQKIIDKMEKA